MALYAIMGVQLFGRMDYHCVLEGTNPSNVTILDLMVPDTMCSGKGEGSLSSFIENAFRRLRVPGAHGLHEAGNERSC